MPTTKRKTKETSFNLRIDSALKAAFTAAAEAEEKPAAQVVRDFMRTYVQMRERRLFEAEARRQSREAAAAARDPSSKEHAMLKEIEAEFDRDDFAADWKA